MSAKICENCRDKDTPTNSYPCSICNKKENPPTHWTELE